MGEDGAERRPEQVAYNLPWRQRDPHVRNAPAMRQLHDEVASLVASSKNENNTSISSDVDFQEGMKNEECSDEKEEQRLVCAFHHVGLRSLLL